MTRFICTTCGTQNGDRTEPPDMCAICSDDRQYVGWSGQHWTTLEELQAAHTVRLEVDDGLLGVGITPAFGIPQRSLVLPTSSGQHPVGDDEPRDRRRGRRTGGARRDQHHRDLTPALLCVDGRVE